MSIDNSSVQRALSERALARQEPQDNLLAMFPLLKEDHIQGGLTWPFHYLRRALLDFWLTWHARSDPALCRELITKRVFPLLSVYDFEPFECLRGEFDAHLLMCSILTSEPDLMTRAARVATRADPANRSHQYCTALSGVLQALVLRDASGTAEQLEILKRRRPARTFYWPSTVVVEASCQGNKAVLRKQCLAIASKFDGYAHKYGALTDAGLDVTRLDEHWFWPYPDYVLYALAGSPACVTNKETIWFPTELLRTYWPQHPVGG